MFPGPFEKVSRWGPILSLWGWYSTCREPLCRNIIQDEGNHAGLNWFEFLIKIRSHSPHLCSVGLSTLEYCIQFWVWKNIDELNVQKKAIKMLTDFRETDMRKGWSYWAMFILQKRKLWDSMIVALKYLKGWNVENVESLWVSFYKRIQGIMSLSYEEDFPNGSWNSNGPLCLRDCRLLNRSWIVTCVEYVGVQAGNWIRI